MRATTTVMSSACSGVPAHCSAAATRFSAMRAARASRWRNHFRVQALHAEFLAVHAFGFRQSVAEGHHQSVPGLTGSVHSV